MLVNITHDTKAEHRRLLLAGVAFLTVIAMLIWLSIAIYDKAFAHVTWVTVKAERAGLQLAQFGDVRRHGVLVGQVRSITQDGDEASIKVAFFPSAAKQIPENVRVDIVPTTLFGQKYLAMMDPARPSSQKLSNGDTIPSSRVHTNVELQTILANLFPLLRSIRPADLSSTLYAIATALRGRGDKIGDTMVRLDSYLSRLNVKLPTLKEDLALLARVAHTYALAAPDLIRLMRNATTTARTVTGKENQLHAFFGDVTGLGATSTRILKRNGDAIVAQGEAGRPLLGLLDTYSPEFPCLLEGADRYADRLNGIFYTGRVSQSMHLNSEQKRPYDQRDRPVYGEVGHGPWCLGLPNPPQPAPALDLKNGTDLDHYSGGH